MAFRYAAKNYLNYLLTISQSINYGEISAPIIYSLVRKLLIAREIIGMEIFFIGNCQSYNLTGKFVRQKRKSNYSFFYRSIIFKVNIFYPFNEFWCD